MVDGKRGGYNGNDDNRKKLFHIYSLWFVNGQYNYGESRQSSPRRTSPHTKVQAGPQRGDAGARGQPGKVAAGDQLRRDDISQFSLNGRNNSWISKLDCLTRVQELVWRLTPQVSPPSRSSDTSGLSLNPELGPFLWLRKACNRLTMAVRRSGDWPPKDGT
jgi:hypothetical protein